MKKLTILMALAIVGQLQLHAVVIMMPFEKLPSEDGPTFAAQDKGLTIRAHFPSKTKDINTLDITLELINQTGGEMIIRDFSFLRGFYFRLEDSSGNELQGTDLLIRARAGTLMGVGGSEPMTVSGGFTTVPLKQNWAFVITEHLGEYYHLKSPGEYRLFVNWRDSDKNGGWWLPSQTPRLHLMGKILLQTVNDGIAISSVK